ncbi:MAG TPA: ABC transporter substrate-binding protein [Polyangiaceae bacterium]
MRSIERALRCGALLPAALALSGCQGKLDAPLAAAHPNDGTPRQGGTLHLASFATLGTLDPALANDMFAAGVVRMLFAGLVDFDPEGRVLPDLAERIDLEDGGRTYRFTLHSNVTFHDGTELTAADVKRSFERALDPDTPCPTSSFYEGIVGFEDFTTKRAPHLAGVAAQGRYVVAIHLREPDATFLPALALSAVRVTCPSAGDKYTPGWTPCGAGPFRLPPGGWEPGASLALVRHERYFRPGLPHLDGVTWELSSTLLGEGFKFAHGSLDAIHELSQADTIRYLADARWHPFGAYEPAHEVHGEAMNVELPPFDNVEVRRALAAAIDRDHLVLLKSTALTSADKPVLPMPGYDPPPGLGQRYDLPAALEHMKKAGYPFDPATGQGGWPTPIPYEVFKQSIFEASGQLLAQDLARIGLKIEIHVASYPTYLTLTHQRRKVPLSPQGWTQDFPDPSDFLEPLFSSRSIADESSSNAAFYSNPALDALLARARREGDGAERSRLYGEAERIVCDEAPWAFEYAIRTFHVWQPYVRSYRVHAVWPDDLTPVWLDRRSDTVARSAPLSRELLGSLQRVGP